MGWQWHQLDHMQTICISLQTDNYTITHYILQAGSSSWRPTNSVKSLKAIQSTEGKRHSNQLFLPEKIRYAAVFFDGKTWQDSLFLIPSNHLFVKNRNEN